MARGDWDDGVIYEDEEPHTRPFIVAAGKTKPTAHVAIEMLVESTNVDKLVRFEKRKILERASAPISVAELSSHLNMPIGTTMVVVGELLDEGLLKAHKTAEQSGLTDLNIMTRIIQRVREL